MQYEAVMGLEIHVELNTNSKMFCRCSTNYFGQEPNSNVCPTCLGLPGALPYINAEAIDKCIKIGLSLGCSISTDTLFERKNYFYPDLPKGYQVSQLRWPLCVAGQIEVRNSKNENKIIRINRVHQEEDTGKLTHQGNLSLIDYNRSSVPLVEIVTEPDFSDVEEVVDYAKKLQQLFRYLGVSEADMERGDMRLEANISVRPVGQKTLPPYRVELKNINSFRFMKQAILFEISRQIAAHESGEELKQETRGWNETKNQTFLQRSKEEANDYRYFPEPDLPAMKIDQEHVNQIRSELPELPWVKKIRFMQDYDISEQVAAVLVENRSGSDNFESVVAKNKQINPKDLANYLVNKSIDLDSDLFEVVELLLSKKSNTISDTSELEKICSDIIENNAEVVERIKTGNVNAIQVLIGQVMRMTQGKADAVVVREIFDRLLT